MRLIPVWFAVAVFGATTIAHGQLADDQLPLVPVGFCGSAPACCDCCPPEDCCDAPEWYATADALFLDRTQHYAGVLAVDVFTNNPAVTGKALDFGVAAGPRLSIGRVAASGMGVEGVYFGMQNWNAVAATPQDGVPFVFRVPGDLAHFARGFWLVDTINYSYGSKIQNVEANVFRRLGKLDLLAGFRYFSLSEDFRLSSYDFGNQFGNYTIDTRNRLYGAQLGARYRQQYQRLGFAISAKAGIFGNASGQTTSIVDRDWTSYSRNVTMNDMTTSFVGDLNFAGTLRLTDVWFLTAGYQLLWVQGVALAPYQLDFSVTPDSSRFVDNDRGVFYHGATVGLGATW